MNRRRFLTGLLTASAAGIAAHFGVSEDMAGEVKSELARDLNRIVVGPPRQIFENRPIWMSVEPSARVWADFIMKQYQIERDYHNIVMQATRRMAKAIDFDLHQAKVEKGKQKVIIETPLVRNFRKLRSGRPEFELVAGLESKKGLYDESYRVGYIQSAPELLNRYGESMSNRKELYTGDKPDRERSDVGIIV